MAPKTVSWPCAAYELGRTRERLVAAGYALTYDAIVRGFAPFQALVDEIVALVARSARAGKPRRETRVLDVACGTGTVALRLAAEGYSVVAVDGVRRLAAVARRRSAAVAHGPAVYHADLARDSVPGAGSFDVLVSMHTLYWHPQPERLLTACRAALAPGGHAIFLTYARPARVMATFRDIRARQGAGAALRALRWLLPTAVFEMFRRHGRRYLSREAFHQALSAAGFEVLESRETFLADISRLAWTRVRKAGGVGA